MAEKSGLSLAGQYSNSSMSDSEVMERVQNAYKALQAANIVAQIELHTGSKTIQVLVESARRDAAREALKDVLPTIPRRLKMRVDAASLRRVTPAIPVLLPGDQFIIGRSSVVSTNEKAIVINDDPKIEGQHLVVRWDGLSKLEIKDVSSKQDGRIDTVEIGPDWMEVEPGAKIRLGDTTLIFQLGDPVN